MTRRAFLFNIVVASGHNPPDFQYLVPSRKTPDKSGGADDQIRPIFVEAENF
jgi:hypothetical protein